MTYKPSVLNVSAGLFLISCILYTLANYAALSKSEGWGVVAMFGLFGFGLLFLLIDLLLQVFIKNRKTVNIVGLIIAVAVFIFYITA